MHRIVMDRQMVPGRSRDQAVESLRQQVETVGGIRLVGAPRSLILDVPALLTDEGKVPDALAAKLRVLSRHERMWMIVCSPRDTGIREAFDSIAPVEVVPSLEEAGPQGPAIAILTHHRPLPSKTYAWDVGGADEATPFHSARQTGAEATDKILALFGTALAQERAGIAFRAAGAGTSVPREAPFDPCILDGIAAAVADHAPADGDSAPDKARREPIDLDREMERLVGVAVPPILATQDHNGAIAAAPPPRGPGEPNYWFFWQRDAGQVVVAMAQLARDAPESRLRDLARRFIARYLDFVAALPCREGVELSDLGESRFAMNGRPIAQYGNPQKDGPAHTVLAVTTALGQNARADAICRPYLDYLDAFIVGPSFDPWEFAVGDMFFDLNLARRALRRGARLARAHGRPDDARRYGARAGEIEEALGAFALPAEPWIRARRNLLQPFLGTISQLDIAVIGSVLTAYDVEDDVLNLDDLRVQRTMATLESACERRWPVNVAWRRSGNAGLGMGRFPEDANDGIGSTGGNPWTFATLWAAQYYLRLIQRLDFLGMEDPKGRTRADLFEQADGYLRFVLAHGSAEALTEQIDGRTGAPRGAKQLAWAQAALVQTLLIRQEISSQWRTGTPR